MDAGNAVVFLNGRFLPRAQATLDIEDRGTLFADGVYEVLRYYQGKPLAMPEHLARLELSLSAVEISPTDETRRIESLSAELLTRNKLSDAKVYWQITRGAAPREHAFPKAARPTVLMIASPAEPMDPSAVDRGPRTVGVILAEDERWHRCDIKSLMLLPNVLAKNRALQAGAHEAILHRGGTVTEATSTSVLTVRGGELWTHPADQWILGGVTRLILLRLARQAGLVVHERAFSVEALRGADEVLICGTTTQVAAVVSIDGRPVGDGKVGPVTARLNRLFAEHIRRVCG